MTGTLPLTAKRVLAMANSTTENRIQPQDARPRVSREFREMREAAERMLQAAKPARRRRRANEITKAIGLTPITGLSGPKIAY